MLFTVIYSCFSYGCIGGTIAQVINGSGVGILMNTQTAADHDQHMYGSEAGYYVIGGHYVEIKTIQDWNAVGFL